jgi:hypothetical protein
VRARLGYGRLRKDLEDEWAEVRLKVDGQWQTVATGLSDDDGALEIVVPGRWLGAPGPLPVELRVPGDGSAAHATIWVLAPGRPVAIFDIDETLAKDGFVRHMLFGSAVTARPAAVELVARHAASGVLPIYLTGRSYVYADHTRHWLDEAGFVRGPLIMSHQTGSGLPWHAIEDYKRRWLAGFLATVEPEVRAAYGNSESDACAYALAGIPPSRTFLWGDESPPCEGYAPAEALDDYGPHTDGLR